MRRARFDPALSARVVERSFLRYGAGPEASLDRPGHVRAASAASWCGKRLAVVQDDAGFVALVDPNAPESCEAIPLEAGEGGLRQFDDVRRNKAFKLDLEASIAVDGTLIAFGSGSTARRERILVVHDVDGPRPRARLVDASAFYARLRDREDFAGSELNLEGAAAIADRVRLFQRGNGAPRGDRRPIDASCDVSLEALRAFLDGGAPPALENVLQYDLGTIDGVRLTFTDAAFVNDTLFYLAAAEASPDAVRDGPVAGVVLGVIDGDDVRCARVRLGDGWFDGKAEGLAFDANDPLRGYLVVDRDDPGAPAELWSFELSGSWR